MAIDGVGSFNVDAWSEAGDHARVNEDWYSVVPDIPAAVVLDGGTARTETGCRHGVAWYTQRLGHAVQRSLATDPLSAVLRQAIAAVAREHDTTCDLGHPGTPSAAVGIVRRRPPDGWDYLLLGDITILAGDRSGVTVIEDLRINGSAVTERAEADRWPIGSAEKNEAMVIMKRAELAERNRTFWIAATDTRAIEHAITGILQGSKIALLTDGAARANTFGLASWPQIFRQIDERDGPRTLIQQVRTAEESDRVGQRWPRNKASDDATAVILTANHLSGASP